MTPLDLYRRLPAADRRVVRVATLRAHKPRGPLPAWDDVVTDPADPALVEALRAWWPSAAIRDVCAAIAASGDARLVELAIVLCSESCAQYTTDPRVAECRRVRLAWVRGDASDAARTQATRAAARAAAWAALGSAAEAAALSAVRAAVGSAAEAAALSAVRAAVGSAVRAAARDAASTAARAAARDAASTAAGAALARRLRVLVPDPCRVDWRDALTRWDAAIAEGRS